MARPQTNTSHQAVIDQRRTLVSWLRLRGATQREIVAMLLKEGIVNQETGKAWSLATVNRDIDAVRKEWQREYAATYDEHVSEMRTQIREVRREAWRLKDLDLVLKCCTQEAKLLGLDKPDRLIVDWRREAMEAGIDAGNLFENLVREFAAVQQGD